jgi:uncharacterized membrane protein
MPSMERRIIFSSIEAVFAFSGCAVAGTLYWAHRSNVELPCSTGDGCDLVNASHWSRLGSLPVSLIGLAGYVLVLFASVIKLTAVDRILSDRLLAMMTVITALGTVYSWYLQYVAHVYIGAFCLYCRSSAIIMTVLLVLALSEMLTEKVTSRKNSRIVL